VAWQTHRIPELSPRLCLDWNCPTPIIDGLPCNRLPLQWILFTSCAFSLEDRIADASTSPASGAERHEPTLGQRRSLGTQGGSFLIYEINPIPGRGHRNRILAGSRTLAFGADAPGSSVTRRTCLRHIPYPSRSVRAAARILTDCEPAAVRLYQIPTSEAPATGRPTNITAEALLAALLARFAPATQRIQRLQRGLP
jgi:hypothetical protein